MTFVHDNGDERATPPTEGTLHDGRTVSGIQPDDLALLAECGWHPVTPTPRPDDTATHTADRTVVDNVETWTTRKWTADELAVRTATTNRTTIEGQALTALADNTTFLAISVPTNAQTLAQVKALTRQTNKLIRLVINKPDATT